MIPAVACGVFAGGHTRERNHRRTLLANTLPLPERSPLANGSKSGMSSLVPAGLHPNGYPWWSVSVSDDDDEDVDDDPAAPSLRAAALAISTATCIRCTADAILFRRAWGGIPWNAGPGGRSGAHICGTTARSRSTWGSIGWAARASGCCRLVSSQHSQTQKRWLRSSSPC